VFASIFQLSGAVLLAIMIISRRTPDIISASYGKYAKLRKQEDGRVVARKNKDMLEKCIETMQYRVGICYIVAGYAIPVIGYDVDLNNLNLPWRISLSLLLFAVFLFIGYFASRIMGNQVFNKIKPEDIKVSDVIGIVTDDD
jgi:hypothetical protein